MFYITLGGAPVDSRVSYRTYRRAAQIAHRRYSDPPLVRPACPAIPRRLWWAKGYRIESISVADVRSERRKIGPKLRMEEGIRCEGGPPICFMPPRPLGRGVYGSKYYGQGGC